jgi:hypothetical protein
VVGLADDIDRARLGPVGYLADRHGAVEAAPVVCGVTCPCGCDEVIRASLLERSRPN